MPTIIFILLPDKGRLQREQLRESRLPLLLDQQHYHKNYIYGSLTPSINCKSNDCGSLMPYIICKTAHRINNADHGTPIPSSASSGGAQMTTPTTSATCSTTARAPARRKHLRRPHPATTTATCSTTARAPARCKHLRRPHPAPTTATS